MRGAQITDVRCRKLGKISLASRAESVAGDNVEGEWVSGIWIPGNRWRAATTTTGNIVPVTCNLRCRWDPSLPHLAAALAIPLLRPEEEEFVLLDRSTYGVTKVVAA